MSSASVKTYQHAWYEENKSRLVPRTKTENAARYLKESARRKEYQKAYRLAHLEDIKAQKRTAKYGITKADYNAMVLHQGNKCATCNETMVKPHVDHHHMTGQVRGLLCRECNLTLGNAHDDPALLRQMADYLEKSF